MIRVHLLLAATLVVLSLLAAGCGGSSDAVDVEAPGTASADIEKWEKASSETFDAATRSLERAKVAVGRIKSKGNGEAIASLTAAQTAIQEVSAKQKEAADQLKMATEMIFAFKKINRELAAEKKKLEADKADLQSRERLFSLGFYASLGAAVVALAAVLAKLPTAFLDRTYRKLEIEQKHLELLNAKRQAISASALPIGSTATAAVPDAPQAPTAPAPSQVP